MEAFSVRSSGDQGEVRRISVDERPIKGAFRPKYYCFICRIYSIMKDNGQRIESLRGCKPGLDPACIKLTHIKKGTEYGAKEQQTR